MSDVIDPYRGCRLGAMADEQYLTPAQVADELHVTVVTVRRWIANGELRASKAGPRKWMIRRSDLADFVSGSASREVAVEASEDPSFRRYLVVPGDVEQAKEQLELAEGRWESAIREHAQPPPDPGFARRLRALADAAAQEQAAYRYADDDGFGWRPGPAWLPPRELRPAPWRESLAPADLWERFDYSVEGLSRARTGLSVVAIALAFGELSAAAWELAHAVDRERSRTAGTA